MCCATARIDVITVSPCPLPTQIRDFWGLMLRDQAHAAHIEKALDEVDHGVQNCYRAYKKVLDRSPKNGNLLKCYGIFLEDIKNDFRAASKVWALVLV